ncbi:MAG TPA: ABC transporter permease [Acidimicrobiales bacterium]|nr:ABC transporter permease [Acidimicrobiales bacterium]
MSTSEAVLRQAGDTFVPVRRRLFRRLARDRTAVAGLVIIVLFVGAALLAPVIAKHDPIETNFSNRFATPSASHPLGTDNVGRDVFARILHGARLSLGMAVSATAGITVLGIVLGLVAGMYGRFAETMIMRAVDVLLALPTLILALVVVGLLGQGLRNLIITIILVQWPRYARLVRGMTLKVREQVFVEAARAIGASRLRIMFRHVAPNLLGPTVVFSTIDMGSTLLSVSALSFLGFGVGPPTPEWGAMLAEARSFIDRAPQLIAWPGIAITLMVLAFNLAGDGLRDLLDPRTMESTPGLERRGRARRRRASSVTPPSTTELAVDAETAEAGGDELATRKGV